MRSGLLDQAFADNSEPVCWNVTTVEKMEAAFVQAFSLRSVERDGNEEEADGEDMQQVRLAKEARLCDLLSALKEAGELVHELFGDNQIMSGFHYLCECHVEWVIGYIFWCASVRCTRIQGCICIGNILRFLIPLHDKSKLRVRLDDEKRIRPSLGLEACQESGVRKCKAGKYLSSIQKRRVRTNTDPLE